MKHLLRKEFCLLLFYFLYTAAHAQQRDYSIQSTLNSLFGNSSAEEVISSPLTEDGKRYRNTNYLDGCPAATTSQQQNIPVTFQVDSKQLQVALDSLNSIRDRVHVTQASDGHFQIAVEFKDLQTVELTAKDLIPLEASPGQPVHQIQDRRTKLGNLTEIDQYTVYTADAAYDVVSNEHIQNPVVELNRSFGSPHPRLEAKYKLVKIYSDLYSGFKAIAFESTSPKIRKHRIYSLAGTYVFFRPDLRTWANGLSLGRIGSVSETALELIEDAAQFAMNTGEVLVSGQSQGGILAQNIGFLLQMRLNAEQMQSRETQPNLVHVVALGAVGSVEGIRNIVQNVLNKKSRGYPRQVEKHLSFIQPAKYRLAMQTWDRIQNAMRVLPASANSFKIDQFILNEARKMRVIGYFFQLDLFARTGTFLGSTYLLPYETALPRTCDELQAQQIVSEISPSFAFVFETHFMNGYRRGFERGAISMARYAVPKKWSWVLNLQRILDPVAEIWMHTLFLEQTASTEENWKLCQASKSWSTFARVGCTQSWYPGCSRQSEELSQQINAWCLIDEQ